MSENTKYKVKEINEDLSLVIDGLKSNGVDPLLAKLYALRGVSDLDEVNIENEKLEPYNNLLNIKDACILLNKAINNKERICIVADYDSDGATACAIGILGLRMFGADIDYVVPNRFIHGYGLTESVVDEAINKNNPTLIITVDNGIASFSGVDYAKEKGIKVLVTDHHLQGDGLPNAECIVNPNQNACTFNSKSLAGCGVIFYILAAYRQFVLDNNEYTLENIPKVFSLLDLVAVGTVGDLVKLDKNNRILVKRGLKLIRSGKARPGILALAAVSGKEISRLSTSDIGFNITPRINAAGRLADMKVGIECLITNDHKVAMELAEELHNINNERKNIESEMKDDFLLNIEDTFNNESFSCVHYDPSYHEGVIGIVASRIKEMFYKPTIVFTNTYDNEDLIKGSGRSINEIHLRDALDYVHKKNPNIIQKFGGHAMAAGLTIYKDKLDEFKRLFEESIMYYAENKRFVNIVSIDADLEANEINLNNARVIESDVWGQGFEYPLFVKRFKVIEQSILKEAHLRLKLFDGEKEINGIWFFRDSYIKEENASLVFSMSINYFRNNESLQLMIKDML